jgi:hypothetical protein
MGMGALHDGGGGEGEPQGRERGEQAAAGRGGAQVQECIQGEAGHGEQGAQGGGDVQGRLGAGLDEEHEPAGGEESHAHGATSEQQPAPLSSRRGQHGAGQQPVEERYQQRDDRGGDEVGGHGEVMRLPPVE